MKALSIRQPWAGLIAAQIKTIETRTWTTKYRGPLLIVAGRQIDEGARQRFLKAGTPYSVFPQGVAVAVVELVDCFQMADVHEKAAMVPARPGLFGWRLELIAAIDKPFPVKGKLGLFEVEVDARAFL